MELAEVQSYSLYKRVFTLCAKVCAAFASDDQLGGLRTEG